MWRLAGPQHAFRRLHPLGFLGVASSKTRWKRRKTRVRIPPAPLHASVVSTASTRPLYGRGAGSIPAGGSLAPLAGDGSRPGAAGLHTVAFRRSRHRALRGRVARTLSLRPGTGSDE